MCLTSHSVVPCGPAGVADCEEGQLGEDSAFAG